MSQSAQEARRATCTIQKSRQGGSCDGRRKQQLQAEAGHGRHDHRGPQRLCPLMLTTTCDAPPVHKVSPTYFRWAGVQWGQPGPPPEKSARGPRADAESGDPSSKKKKVLSEHMSTSCLTTALSQWQSSVFHVAPPGYNPPPPASIEVDFRRGDFPTGLTLSGSMQHATQYSYWLQQ